MKKLITLLSMLMLCLAVYGDAPDKAAKINSHLLKAIEDGNYKAFIKDGIDEFKAALSEEAFESVVKQLSNSLKKGYDLEYLTKMKQKGYDVYLWKVKLEGLSDSYTAKLVLDGDKVAGYWIQ